MLSSQSVHWKQILGARQLPSLSEIRRKPKRSKHLAKFSQLGKIKSLLNEVQRKVKEREPHKNWEFEPIFEYKFRKLHFFQATQHKQAKTEFRNRHGNSKHNRSTKYGGVVARYYR